MWICRMACAALDLSGLTWLPGHIWHLHCTLCRAGMRLRRTTGLPLTAGQRTTVTLWRSHPQPAQPCLGLRPQQQEVEAALRKWRLLHRVWLTMPGIIASCPLGPSLAIQRATDLHLCRGAQRASLAVGELSQRSGPVHHSYMIPAECCCSLGAHAHFYLNTSSCQ